MGATPVSRRRATSERLRASAPRRALAPAETAWIAAVLCVLLTVLGMMALGPLIGHAFLMPRTNVFWPVLRGSPQPEQHGRFLVALLGPPLLAAVVLAQASARVRARLVLPVRMIHALVLASQAALAAFVLACFAAQNDIVLDADFPPWSHVDYFRWRTLLLSALLPGAALLLLRRPGVSARLPVLLRETPRRRLVCIALAASYTALWMTTAVNVDSSIANTHAAVAGHLLWTMSEAFAVLDGRTPLVDYHAQYGQLWAYLAAAPMALLGTTVLTYTLAMATGTGLAVFAVYAILRRVTRSSTAALALYVPFLATAFFTILGPLTDRYGPQNLYLLWPIRYAGPLLLAWLTVRHVGGAVPRRRRPLFLVAGLVAVNNPDWGLAGALATLAALAAARPQSLRGLGRLAFEAVTGVAGAIVVFSLFTLVRAGTLPQFGLLFEFSRLYGVDGWGQVAMPDLGLHVVVFLTFVAALATAAVRVVRGAQEPLLTSALAWVSVFGLAASVYYVGRAHPLALFDFFAPWALAVILLLLAALPGLAARDWRRPALPELALLFALGLIVCSLPQTPTPWSQLARVRDRTETPVFEQRAAVRLVEQTSEPGEKVAILIPLGNRVAYDAGVVNVSPYSSVESMPTRELLARMLDAIRREGASKMYVDGVIRPEQRDALEAAGFAFAASDPSNRYVLLTDRS
jgi:hypothetical protein